MRLPAKIVASLLLPALSGCFLHKTEKPPAQPLAPKITAASAAPPPTTQPPLDVTIPTQPPVTDNKLPAKSPAKPQKHRKSQPAPSSEAQQAAAAAPAVSAIGQLSSGAPSESRRQAEVSIAETERGLYSLNRQLNDSERKTAAHIREFIKQAKTALASGDVDGAATLIAKAKVLLAELKQ